MKECEVQAFLQELKNIKRYYERANLGLKVISDNNKDVAVVPEETDEISLHKTYLGKTTVIMFCIAWEKFAVKEMKIEAYYNDPIIEIIVLRDCVVHHNDFPHDQLIKLDPTKYKSTEKIVPIDGPEIDRQFQVFLSAYLEIINKK